MRLPNQSKGISGPSLRMATQAGIVPSRWSWINVGYPELAWGYWRDLLDIGPSPAECDLSCGEQRADCYREGNSRKQCKQEHQECLMGCFFNADDF